MYIFQVSHNYVSRFVILYQTDFLGISLTKTYARELNAKLKSDTRLKFTTGFAKLVEREAKWHSAGVPEIANMMLLMTCK